MDAGFGTAIIKGLCFMAGFVLGGVVFVVGLVMWALDSRLFGGLLPAALIAAGAVVMVGLALLGLYAR